MSTSNHERLLQLAKEAIHALIADESVNLETMEESLDELAMIVSDEHERIEGILSAGALEDRGDDGSDLEP